MRMLNKLPRKIKIKNKRYFINTDFRIMIRFENKMQELKMTNKKGITIEIYKILKSFCPAFFKDFHKNMEKDIKLLLKSFLWFYQGGSRENYHKGKGGSSSNINIYSYEYDDEYIWSAFYQYFNIDLSFDKVHWWKYMAIFKSLPEECKFEKIKGYRAYKGKDKDMKELKRYWTLPLDKNLQKQIDETTKYLMEVSKEVK